MPLQASTCYSVWGTEGAPLWSALGSAQKTCPAIPTCLELLSQSRFIHVIAEGQEVFPNKVANGHNGLSMVEKSISLLASNLHALQS